MHGVVNIEIKFSFFKKIPFYWWQDDTTHTYKSLYLHCGASTKFNQYDWKYAKNQNVLWKMRMLIFKNWILVLKFL